MTNEDIKTWTRQVLDFAAQSIGDEGFFDDMLIEVKPAWALPHRLLIGKVREQGNPQTFRWFVCGEVPLDHVPSNAAYTPREALRYFAMKWQLDASRLEGKAADALIDHAEAVHTLADDDRFWQTS